MIDIILGTGDIKQKYHTIFPFVIMPFGVFKFTDDGVEHIELPMIHCNNEPYFVVDTYES